MSNQLEYDITEYVLNNRQEINEWLISETSHLDYCERIFDSIPEMYDELLLKARRDKLKEFLVGKFEANAEDLASVVTDNFVKITLENENE